MASGPITAKTAWYDFILDGIEASEITFANDVLTVSDYQGKVSKRIPAKDIAGLTIEEGPLRNGLTIATKKGQPIKIAGLRKKSPTKSDEPWKDESASSRLRKKKDSTKRPLTRPRNLNQK